MDPTRNDVSVYRIYRQVSARDGRSGIFRSCLFVLFLVFGLFRFQDQTNFYNNKASDFKKALEEAVLAENGVEGSCGAAEISCPESSATQSDQEHGPAYRSQARFPDTYSFFHYLRRKS